MWWRLPTAQWKAQKGESNRKAMRSLVVGNRKPGLLAYADGQPVGWCAIAPRLSYVRLAKSRVLEPVDDMPVWSVPCFFVARGYRRQGVTIQLLKAAAVFARQYGAHALEGYPTEPKRDQPDAFLYTGLASAFRKAGFKEVARRSASRPIFRRVLRLTPTSKVLHA
jgi:GNAT superfamily N-acetyltransferase